jgi:hypothetical protein
MDLISGDIFMLQGNERLAALEHAGIDDASLLSEYPILFVQVGDAELKKNLGLSRHYSLRQGSSRSYLGK